MDSITQKARVRLSALKFANSHGVTQAANEFHVSRQSIYRWRKRYDGTLESLKDKSRRPHYHPKQHTDAEIDLIKKMRVKYVNDGLNLFWYRLSCKGYTRSMPALFRVMRRLGLYRLKPRNPKYTPKLYAKADFPGQKIQIETLFEEQLLAYGIEYQRIRPYTPRHNGKVERSHQRDNEGFYSLNKFYSFEEFESKLAAWNAFTNELPMRPLNYKSPVETLVRFL